VIYRSETKTGRSSDTPQVDSLNIRASDVASVGLFVCLCRLPRFTPLLLQLALPLRAAVHGQILLPGNQSRGYFLA
jgi:hypothetical protein